MHNGLNQFLKDHSFFYATAISQDLNLTIITLEKADAQKIGILNLSVKVAIHVSLFNSVKEKRNVKCPD